MKKVIIVLLMIVTLAGIGLWYVKNNVGDLRPALMPAVKKKPAQSLQSNLGTPLDFDVTISDGFQIGIFAKDLGAVRDLTFSPGGVLIASVPTLGKVIMLPDRNTDGVADEVNTIVSGLNKPHGVSFYENFLYVAEETNVSRYLWTDQKLIGGVARLEKKLFDLPKGGRHFTRTIAFDKTGTMYVSVGSSCDVCYENNPFLASVIVSDYNGKTPRTFAKGLRNAPFININPTTQELWGTEMGRDFLGDNLPPDEVNIINNPSAGSGSSGSEPSNYGWPICYGMKIHDTKFDKNVYTEDPCLNTISPVFEIPAHSAPLGLQFINSEQFPSDWQGDLLVAYHGSWNRSSPIGYKVVRMHMNENTIEREEDFLSGFLQNNTAVARPVDLEFDKNGNLYISDDKSGTIFIVSKK